MFIVGLNLVLQPSDPNKSSSFPQFLQFGSTHVYGGKERNLKTPQVRGFYYSGIIIKVLVRLNNKQLFYSVYAGFVNKMYHIHTGWQFCQVKWNILPPI